MNFDYLRVESFRCDVRVFNVLTKDILMVALFSSFDYSTFFEKSLYFSKIFSVNFLYRKSDISFPFNFSTIIRFPLYTYRLEE